MNGRRDRTRRFTVGFGAEHDRHVRILAADEKTKAWANRNAPVIQVVLHTLEQRLSTTKLASDRALWQPPVPPGIETPKTIRASFEALMRKGFPEEAFEIQAELQ